MTLGIIWRRGQTVHIASDSRLSFDATVVDMGIKVLSAQYRINGPTENGQVPILAAGDLGICVAGSALASLTLREALADVLLELQAVPGFSKISIDGITDILFQAYEVIMSKLYDAMGLGALSTVVVTGLCPEHQDARTFHLTVNPDGTDRRKERVLTRDNEHLLIGNGQKAAEKLLPANPTDSKLLEALKAVIDDANQPSVGGNIQYGALVAGRFRTYGIADLKKDVHYWRAGLDLNDPTFTESSGLFLGYPQIDPFGAFKPEDNG